jgi:hypothetical protein
LTPEQLELLNSPKQFKFGFTYLSYVAEPRYFLHWMKHRLSEAKGVTWETKKVESIDEQCFLKNGLKGCQSSPPILPPPFSS